MQTDIGCATRLEVVTDEILGNKRELVFCLPDEWTHKVSSDKEGCLTVSITAPDYRPEVGEVYVQVMRRTDSLLRGYDSNGCFKRCSELMQTAGYTLTGSPILDCPPIRGFDKGWIYSPSATYEGHRFDAPVLLYEKNEYVVLLGLIGICREESPEWWAVNKATFELVRDTLRVGESALEEAPEPVTEKAIEIIEKPMFPNAGTMPSRV